MDPASVVGLVSSAVGVAEIIAKSLTTLRGFQTVYKAADLSVRIIETQLTAVRAALDGLQRWMKCLKHASDDVPLLTEIEMAVGCCGIIVKTLFEKINRLQRRSMQPGLTSAGKLGYILGEAFIKQMRSDLTDLAVTLQLLLNTSKLSVNPTSSRGEQYEWKCSTPSERIEASTADNAP